MVKKFFILFLFLSSISVFAQTNNDYYIYKYGVDYFNSKEYNRALNLFEKYLFIYSTDGDYSLNCYEYLYKIAMVKKNYNQAIKYLLTIIKNFPERIELALYYCRVADIYFHLADYQKALKYYNYILLKFPDSSESEYAQTKIDQIIFITSEKIQETQ